MEQGDSGKLVFQEGQEAKYLCVVVEGQVDLRYEMPGRQTSEEQTISQVLPGKVFGWSSLVPPHKITLSSYCGDQGCKYYRLPGKDLIGLFESSPKIGYICMRNLTRVVAERFLRMENEVARLEGISVMHKW